MSMTNFKHFLRHPLLYLLRAHARHVILHITNRCTLRCRTCFVTKEALDMDLAQVRLVAKKIGTLRWLDIGGGEPFLHPQLVEICQCFPNSAITIPTNGQQPEQIFETAQELCGSLKKPLTLAVSLDGFETTNDYLRGTGSYQKAVQTLRLLRTIPGLILKVNTVICEKNFPEMISFMEFVRTLNPDYHSLLLLRGKPEDAALALPAFDELEKATPQLLKHLASYDYGNKNNALLQLLKRRYQRYLWLVNLKTLRTQRCIVPCKAPYLHRVIYPNGALSLCELMPTIGNVFEEPMALLEKRMFDTLHAYEKAKGACFCTHNCNLGENIQSHLRSVISVMLGLDP